MRTKTYSHQVLTALNKVIELVAGHLGEGLFELLGDGLVLLLLGHELVLQPVHLMIKCIRIIIIIIIMSSSSGLYWGKEI